MSLLIAFLTFVLVVNCLFLILLVLIQLPKKEAGAGLAFGGGATDALFGAGSGNALTRMTKFAAGSFLGLALVLTILNTQRAGSSVRAIEAELAKRAASGSVLPSQPVQTTPAVAPSTNVPGIVPLTPQAASTSAPVQLQVTPPPAAGTPAPATPNP